MKISRSVMVTCLAVLGVLAGVTAAHAAAGGLDQTFGRGGIVTTSGLIVAEPDPMRWPAWVAVRLT